MDPCSSLEVVRHPGAPGARSLIAGVVGFRQHTDVPVVRRQPAGSLVPVVVSLADPLHVMSVSDRGEGPRRYASFVAGPQTGHVTTWFAGTMDCVQVYLTPLGASRLLRIPGKELSNRVLDLDLVAPVWAEELADRVRQAGTWPERFAHVDRLLVRLLRGAGEADPMLDWMWDRIVTSGGQARIEALVERSGWSHRHVTARFKHGVGLTPKSAASVVRFERAAADLQALSLGEVVRRHGYADHSHLVRAVNRYAGETPSEHRLARRPTAHTALGRAPGGA